MVSDTDHRTVTVITDEVRTADNWLYCGSLFIDQRFLTDVRNAFLNARYDCDGWQQGSTSPDWQDVDHNDHDIPVTFNRCTRQKPYTIADRWLSLLSTHTAVTTNINMRITGINLSETGVNPDADDPAYTDMYRRILREHFIDARTHFYDASIHVDYTPIYRSTATAQRNPAFQSAVDTITDPLTDFGAVDIVNPDHHTHNHATPQWHTAHLLQLTSLTTTAATTLFTDRNIPHNQAKLAWTLNDLITDSMNYEEPAVDRFTIAFTPKNGELEEFYYWRNVARSDPHKGSLEQFM